MFKLFAGKKLLFKKAVVLVGEMFARLKDMLIMLNVKYKIGERLLKFWRETASLLLVGVVTGICTVSLLSIIFQCDPLIRLFFTFPIYLGLFFAVLFLVWNKRKYLATRPKKLAKTALAIGFCSAGIFLLDHFLHYPVPVSGTEFNIPFVLIAVFLFILPLPTWINGEFDSYSGKEFFHYLYPKHASLEGLELALQRSAVVSLFTLVFSIGMYVSLYIIYLFHLGAVSSAAGDIFLSLLALSSGFSFIFLLTFGLVVLLRRVVRLVTIPL